MDDRRRCCLRAVLASGFVVPRVFTPYAEPLTFVALRNGSWTRTAVMFVGATVPAGAGAILLEHGQVDWNVAMIVAVAWSVVALAVGATMGLLFLIERGQASRAASLIYLVPPTSALMAYAGFRESITGLQAVGFLISAAGVALVQFGGGQQPSR
jgi:drug/metabolite transporter (DMT)-like permease